MRNEQNCAGEALSHADLLLVAPAALELRQRAACVLRGRWRSARLARRDKAALPATTAAVIDQTGASRRARRARRSARATKVCLTIISLPGCKSFSGRTFPRPEARGDGRDRGGRKRVAHSSSVIAFTLPCRDALHAHCRRRTRPLENGFAGTGREMGPLGDPQSIRWLLS